MDKLDQSVKNLQDADELIKGADFSPVKELNDKIKGHGLDSLLGAFVNASMKGNTKQAMQIKAKILKKAKEIDQNEKGDADAPPKT